MVINLLFVSLVTFRYVALCGKSLKCIRSKHRMNGLTNCQSQATESGVREDQSHRIPSAFPFLQRPMMWWIFRALLFPAFPCAQHHMSRLFATYVARHSLRSNELTSHTYQETTSVSGRYLGVILRCIDYAHLGHPWRS